MRQPKKWQQKLYLGEGKTAAGYPLLLASSPTNSVASEGKKSEIPFSEEELTSMAGSLPSVSSAESQLTSRCSAPVVAVADVPAAAAVVVEVEVEATAALPADQQSSLTADALPQPRSWQSAPPWCFSSSGATFSSIVSPAAVPGSMLIKPGTTISSVEIVVLGRGEPGRFAVGELGRDTDGVLGCCRVFCTAGAAVLASLRGEKQEKRLRKRKQRKCPN